jgi:transposase
MVVEVLGGTQKRQHHMKAKRKRHDPEFKARVALEALKGIKTVQQIAKEYDVHPVQVSDWKKKLSAQAGSVFETGKGQEAEDFSAERTELHSKIGELTVMLDFAVKKSKQLGVWSGLPSSSNLNTRH